MTEKSKQAGDQILEQLVEILKPVVLCGVEYKQGDEVNVAPRYIDKLKKLGCIK